MKLGIISFWSDMGASDRHKVTEIEIVNDADRVRLCEKVEELLRAGGGWNQIEITWEDRYGRSK